MGPRFDFFLFGREQVRRLPSNQRFFRRHPEKVDERKREVALLRALTEAEVAALEKEFQPPAPERVAELARSFGFTVEHCEGLFKAFDLFFRVHRALPSPMLDGKPRAR